MDRSSEFVKNKALFGGFPIQDEVKEFESVGVRYFINLTCDGERRTVPYKTKYKYIQYPIIDHRVPTNWREFAKFIVRVVDIIKALPCGEKIYVHCKGGHGRSGIVVACVLCYMYGISASDAIAKTTKYHSRRKKMREKWRKIGSPQTRSQKHFVSRFFESIYVYEVPNNYFSSDFSNNARVSVDIPGLGEFSTVDEAFIRLRELFNSDSGGLVSKFTTESWEDVKQKFMYEILKYKFEQHDSLRVKITETGLRRIIVQSPDLFWGRSGNVGRNVLGELLENLREYFYRQLN